MITSFGRRRFAAAAAALACTAVVRDARGVERPRIDAPVVDSLSIRVVVDGSHDIFAPAVSPPGIKVQRTRTFAGSRLGRTLQSEWGLSLLIESRQGETIRHCLLDFAYTPDVLNNNIELLGIDPATIDALILSHGHNDHWGGLQGFLAAHRNVMRDDLRLYVGGEDIFCRRFLRQPDGGFADFGVLDRRMLEGVRVRSVASELPIVIEGQAFTTGIVPRTGAEHVLPNTFVSYGMKDGAGCDVARYGEHHFTAAELSGQPQPDQHWHEHATCFNLRDRGLVVITSCGHGGIINTVRRARAISGVEKVHALVGGFHLAPAPDDYLAQVMAELKTLEIDYLFPMHCSGTNFIEAAKREMPLSLVACTTGSQFTFGA
jgi:7,8-dihydropterin-6-yl-methyl-4-(beta-D-ribofuranosyl)aminobenzene 5'-phosphate synthase